MGSPSGVFEVFKFKVSEVDPEILFASFSTRCKRLGVSTVT